MHAVNRYVSMRRTTQQHVSSGWLVSSLALVLTLLASCMPIQPPTTFVGLSSGLDNAKQARIRVVDSVMGAPNVDLYINNLPVFNGGKPLQDMGINRTTGWIYITPGTYTVAFVPHGEPLVQPLFAPVAVDAVAGHRYTVATLGQVKEQNIKPLVIDETALLASIHAKATDTTFIDIDNLMGADGITESADDKPMVENIHYGEAVPYLCTSDNAYFKSAVTGKASGVLGEGPYWCEPATSEILPWYGNYPDNVGEGATSQGISELNTLDYLSTFNSHHVVADGHLLTFNTLLAAIDKAGLHDQFVGHDPYYFLAPTDEAFTALPKAQLDALLNDPQALTTLLKAHFIRGYYPYGNLSGPIYGAFGNVSVTNLLGQKLAMSPGDYGMIVNGLSVMAHSYTVGNGNRVQFIDKLLPVK
ncbi:hypothetical protein BH10CHL1_BH10CHL1_33410 [soil metagenome]